MPPIADSGEGDNGGGDRFELDLSSPRLETSAAADASPRHGGGAPDEDAASRAEEPGDLEASGPGGEGAGLESEDPGDLDAGAALLKPKFRRVMTHHDGPLWCMIATPKGSMEQRIASADSEGEVCIWRSENGRMVAITDFSLLQEVKEGKEEIARDVGVHRLAWGSISTEEGYTLFGCAGGTVYKWRIHDEVPEDKPGAPPETVVDEVVRRRIGKTIITDMKRVKRGAEHVLVISLRNGTLHVLAEADLSELDGFSHLFGAFAPIRVDTNSTASEIEAALMEFYRGPWSEVLERDIKDDEWKALKEYPPREMLAILKFKLRESHREEARLFHQKLVHRHWHWDGLEAKYIKFVTDKFSNPAVAICADPSGSRIAVLGNVHLRRELSDAPPITIGSEGHVIVVDSLTGEVLLRCARAHSGVGKDVKYSDSGDAIISCGEAARGDEPYVLVHDASSGELRYALHVPVDAGRTSGVFQMEVLGDLLLTASTSKVLHYWHWRDGEEAQPVKSIAMPKKGVQVDIEDNRTWVWPLCMCADPYGDWVCVSGHEMIRGREVLGVMCCRYNGPPVINRWNFGE